MSEKKKCTCGKSNEKPYCDGSHKVKKLRENQVTDEEFNLFLDALLGPYKGGGYLPE